MAKHSYDDIIITVGALVLGLGLLKFFEGFTEAYAVNVIDCDKPPAPTKADRAFAKTLPPDQRQEYLKGAVADFKSICGQERRRRVGDDTHASTYREPTYPSSIPPRTKTYYPAVPDAVVGDTRSEYAYAYAGAACASACAPFKNSPGTYATCCKQHAATAAAAKPKPKPVVPARPAGFRTATVAPTTAFQKKNPLPVTKSKAPKPASTHQLQNDQVKKASDDTNSTANTETQKNPVQQLTDLVNGTNSSAPPTSAPSGGGGCGTVEYEDHNHGCRHEGEHPQSDASFEYGGTFLIPDANDQLTFEFQGLAHKKVKGKDNDRSGYKVAFNEGKAGIFMWKQEDTSYPQVPGGNSSYRLPTGNRVNITIRKQDIGPASAPIGVEINAFADGTHVATWRDMVSSPLAGQAPYTGVRQGYRVGFRNDGLAHTTTSCPKGTTGPSVICGSLSYRALPNLPS